MSATASNRGQEKIYPCESLVDRLASYTGKHWLRFVTLALGIFVGLPWLAPVFASLNWWGAADVIYNAYALT